MANRGPSRSFSSKAIEFWFGMLAVNWEKFFGENQLKEGRRIYKSQEVSAVELTTKDAIISTKVEREVQYVVLEWEGEKLTWRSSTEDRFFAGALAAAGMMEVEELVAEEMRDVDMDEEADDSELDRSEKLERPVEQDSQKSRRLRILFSLVDEGLAAEAFWVERRGILLPALGLRGEAPALTDEERSKLVALAVYARKFHFKYHQQGHRYVLSVTMGIASFLKHGIAEWKKAFDVRLGEGISAAKKGTKRVAVELLAGKHGGMLDLQWIFKAGERLLSNEEVERLMDARSGQVVLPDEGVLVFDGKAATLVREWRSYSEEKKRGRAGSMPAYMLFSLYQENAIDLKLSPELEGWRKRVLEGSELSFPEEIRTSAGGAVLRPYQRKGVSWLWSLCDLGVHPLLADEMGLGKTLQVLTLMAQRKQAQAAPSLIVCPASVVPVWLDQARQFYPELSLRILNGDGFSPEEKTTVWVSSYGQLRRNRAALADVEFEYAVLDEAQMVKNPDSLAAQACYEVQARHRMVLTGTPLENRILDVWSIFNYLMPGLLGSRRAFEQLHEEGDIRDLRTQLAPFILRRTKDEVAKDLPEKVEIELPCPLTETQRVQYARICAEGLERLGDDVDEAMKGKRFGLLALLTRLRQACCDPGLLPWMDAPLSASGKINVLLEQLAEVIARGHKVVVFSQFTSLLDRVREALEKEFPGLPLHELRGSTVNRHKPVHDFQTGKGAAIILVSLKAGGTGITLSEADYVYLLDPWWNPAVEAQAVDRVHRIGQKNRVFVYRMVTEGTIEERIEELKHSKRELFERLIGRGSPDISFIEQFKSLHELLLLRERQGNRDENGEA